MKLVTDVAVFNTNAKTSAHQREKIKKKRDFWKHGSTELEIRHGQKRTFGIEKAVVLAGTARTQNVR